MRAAYSYVVVKVSPLALRVSVTVLGGGSVATVKLNVPSGFVRTEDLVAFAFAWNSSY